jgi:hypothetical protein
MSPEATARLRAVSDCGILRSTLGDSGLLELFKARLVERRATSVERKWDYRLTDYGRMIAGRLPSGMVGSCGRKVSNDDERNPL